MANWKAHAVEPRQKPSYGIENFRELLERVERERPEIPSFSTLDYSTGNVTKHMPKDVRMQAEGLGTYFFEKGKNKKIIGICGNNCYEWLLAFYGAQYAGSIVLLLDRTVEVDVLKDQIGRSGCKDLIYSKDVTEKAEALAAEFGVEITPFEKIPELAAEGRKLLDNGATGCLDLTLNGDDTAVIMYTSGTTGISKGVMLSTKNLLANAECVQDIINTDRDQVLVVPFNHVYAIWIQLISLTSGRCLHISLNLRHMLDDFKVAKPELLIIVPLIVQNIYSGIWQTIRKRGDEEKVKKMIAENNEKGNVSNEEKRKMFAPYLELLGGRCEILVCGGAPMDPKLYYGMLDFGIPILVGYGITECSPGLSINTEAKSKLGTVGVVFPGHELMIENPDANGIGEICAKGPSVMHGYYRMEEETKEALAGGWFHTGDLGWIDEENYLTITGRIKNLIILSNAENISAEELEAKLTKCEAIAEVCVYEKEDKIAAMIYPDHDYIQREGIQDGEQYIKDFIYEYNQTAISVKKINFIYFRDVPFERTASTKKIKRNFEKM